MGGDILPTIFDAASHSFIFNALVLVIVVANAVSSALSIIIDILMK